MCGKNLINLTSEIKRKKNSFLLILTHFSQQQQQTTKKAKKKGNHFEFFTIYARFSTFLSFCFFDLPQNILEKFAHPTQAVSRQSVSHSFSCHIPNNLYQGSSAFIHNVDYVVSHLNLLRNPNNEVNFVTHTYVAVCVCFQFLSWFFFCVCGIF